MRFLTDGAERAMVVDGGGIVELVPIPDLKIVTNACNRDARTPRIRRKSFHPCVLL